MVCFVRCVCLMHALCVLQAVLCFGLVLVGGVLLRVAASCVVLCTFFYVVLDLCVRVVCCEYKHHTIDVSCVVLCTNSCVRCVCLVFGA